MRRLDGDAQVMLERAIRDKRRRPIDQIAGLTAQNSEVSNLGVNIVVLRGTGDPIPPCSPFGLLPEGGCLENDDAKG